MGDRRKIAVVIASRANYGSIKSALRAIRTRESLELCLLVGASALLDRFGSVIEVVEADGFEPAATFHMIIEGETPTTMAMSTGLGLMELPTLFENLKPGFVLVVGDRFETMSTAIAATYMNIPLAHTMGGEVSGTIDESIRHAVTKMAHLHFPANQESADRIIRMGEDPKSVFTVGCPRIDVVAEVLDRPYELDDALFDRYAGVGDPIDLSEPFLLVVQHPVTTEYGRGRQQIDQTLAAIEKLEMPTLMFWPNVDAGSDDISRGIRVFRERSRPDYVYFLKNVRVEEYIQLMDRCACMVGNSSSAIREGAYIGVPAVNVGTRQAGRDRAENVIDVGYDSRAIVDAVRHQLEVGKYPRSSLYGDGKAGERMADILSWYEAKVQKQISF